MDQAALGDKILDSGEAVDILDVVEQHEAKNLANAGHGLQQIEGVRVMVFGRVDDGTFDVAKQCVIGGDERQINCDTLVDGWVGTALGPPPRGWLCRRSLCQASAG